jgi:hypothetical protein
VVDFNEIWYGGNAIKMDINAIIFNPISSATLKMAEFQNC